MPTLKYTVIRTAEQYRHYCQQLEMLLSAAAPTSGEQEEIDLLTLLITTWDAAQATLLPADPIDLLHYLLAQQGLRAKDLADLLHVSKGTVSDILSRRRSLSKAVIRALSAHFKVSQEAFNRPYALAASPRSAKKPSGPQYATAV